jgi:hypothetical protein
MGRWSDDGRGLAVCDSFGLSTDFHRLTRIIAVWRQLLLVHRLARIDTDYSCLATAVGFATDCTD